MPGGKGGCPATLPRERWVPCLFSGMTVHEGGGPFVDTRQHDAPATRSPLQRSCLLYNRQVLRVVLECLEKGPLRLVLVPAPAYWLTALGRTNLRCLAQFGSGERWRLALTSGVPSEPVGIPPVVLTSGVVAAALAACRQGDALDPRDERTASGAPSASLGRRAFIAAKTPPGPQCTSQATHRLCQPRATC